MSRATFPFDNLYDETLLPETIPGYLALNSFKQDTLAKVKAMGPWEQANYSYTTGNPYARTIEHNFLWGEYFDWLVQDGHASRDLYWQSVSQLNALCLAGRISQ